MENLTTAIISAMVSLSVAVITAWAMRKNEIALRNKQLKEDYYTKLLEGISKAADNDSAEDYVFYRNRIWIAASEDVVHALLKYESIAVPGSDDVVFQEAYSNLIAAMRKDLGIRDKNLPKLHLRSARKKD